MPFVSSILSGVSLGNLFWTEAEISAKKKYLDWEEAAIAWEDIDLSWEEVFILLEIQKKMGGGGMGSPYRGDEERRYREGNPWSRIKEDFGPDAQKSVVKVFCRINGIDYERHRESLSLPKISINEFERFVNESIRVKVAF